MVPQFGITTTNGGTTNALLKGQIYSASQQMTIDTWLKMDPSILLSSAKATLMANYDNYGPNNYQILMHLYIQKDASGNY